MTNCIFTLILDFTMLAIFYRYAVRRLFLQAILDRMSQHEESLKELAENGAVSPSDVNYQFLERQFRIKGVLLKLSVSSFLHFLFCEKTPSEKSDEILHFNSDASPELKKLYSEFCKDTVAWMLLSSPIYSIMGAIILITAIFLFRKKEEKDGSCPRIKWSASLPR